MTSSFNGYSLKLSLSQLSSWHGQRIDPDSIHAIRYQAAKSGPQQSFSAVELRSFYFPNIIPNIMDWSAFSSLKNDVFAWRDNGTDYSITIPTAMWDGCSLASQLQTQMDAAYGTTGTYTVTYDAISGHFSFTTTSGGNISFTPGSTFPWLELGFGYGVGVTGAGGTLTSTAVAQLQGTPNLYLSIPELQNANSAVYNSGSVTFIIPLPSASTYTALWSYQYSAPMKIYTQPTEKTLRDYSIVIFMSRAGVLYPLIMDANAMYEICLCYYSLQI